MELTWRTLSRALEEIRTPFRAVTDLLYGNRNTNATDNLEIGTYTGERRLAPFLTPGAGAFLVPGLTFNYQNVKAPMIRMKKPFEAGRLLFERTPGTPVFIDASGVQSAVLARIARDLAYARRMIDQTTEWMACQTLTGALTYTMAAADGQVGDAFTVDFGRPGSHTVALLTTDRWITAAASATSAPLDHFTDAKEKISDAGFQCTDVIMGTDAAEAFVKNESVRAELDNLRISAGELDFTRPFQANGLLFLGVYCGVRCWRYGKTVTDPFGATVSLIGADKAHFVSATPAADNVIEFGAIEDLQALEGGQLQAEIFSKSWMEPDPSVRMFLWESRPLPIPRRPASMVTYTVV